LGAKAERCLFKIDHAARSADGVGVLRAGAPILELSENVSLSIASSDYAWVNARQVWGTGTANLATGKFALTRTCDDRLWRRSDLRDVIWNRRA
jgi:hypothetical protein